MIHHQPNHRGRAQWYALVALLATVQAVVALVDSDWIEHFFGIAPDAGSGALDAIATGMRITFAVAAPLIVVALAITMGSRGRATPHSLPRSRR